MTVKSPSARTDGQKRYIRSINENQITFCQGPAGSGKTYLACAMASWMLVKGKIEKIILCRPVVSCGNDIGFLPGNLDEKFGPFIIPLFDELGYSFDAKEIQKMVLEKTIELVPSATMRGRTFNNCFVILDESQNCTGPELRMFLTRVGKNCKMVLAGDSTQSDHLNHDFTRAIEALADLEEIGTVYLTHSDIVRNSLITKIINALDHVPKAINNYSNY